MTEGKDIAWRQVLWCGGALFFGVAVGAWALAPYMEKRKEKKAKEKAAATTKGAAKK